jgi:ligand-binding sensor domain-containing protein/signal transduction histidine kinase
MLETGVDWRLNPMRWRFRLFLIFAIATAYLLRAQQPSFRIFNTQDGLVRNWVTKIHRDSRGYLWFCTVEGISLFDGYRFTNFSTRNGLPSRLVSDMIETQRGDYWFATNAGLARFHNHHGKAPAFDAIQVGDSKESNNVEALYQDHDGTIWCGTAAGLYGFRPQDREPVPRLTPLDAAAPAEVLALAEDSRRNLWVATTRALFRRRPSGEIDSLPIPTTTLARIESMVVDGHDRLWAGGYGVAGIDTKTEPPRLLPPEDNPGKLPGRISTLYLSERGEIWIGGSKGLVRFRPDAAPPDVLAYTPSDAFPVDSVRSMEEDVRHNLWVGVGTRGVIRIAGGSFELFTRAQGLDSDEVYGLAESLRGTLYAITGRWTLNELLGPRFVPTPLLIPRPDYTWALGQTVVQDRKGAWWAASGAGVARYAATADARNLKGKSPERVYSVRDGLPNSIVLRLFLDSRGDIWAGTADGLGHWTRANGRWQGFRTSDLIPGSTITNAVHSFAEDRSGNVWAGMYPSGLVRFHESGHEIVTHDVPRGAINSLLSDSQGRLWIGTSQGGVGRMDNPSAAEPQIQHYGLDQGLSSEHIFSLVEDNEGRIYAAGGRGVDRLDPKTASLRHFTSSSGLPPGDTQFLFRDRDGNIWFASFYGLARYRPGPEPILDTPAPLLRALRVGGDAYPISETGEQVVTGMDLAPGHNNLEVEFRALHFDIGEGLRYQYWLEGADNGWSKPSDAETVRYANLAPGNYRLAVRSITESGQISTGQATLAFQVLPVFWRRSWFLVMVALAIVSAAVFLHRYRLNHLLALERVRTRLAADLHDDLGAGLAEIAILSEVAKLKEHPRAMEVLDGIASRARLLREAMTDIVWTVDPREDCLADLVLRLRQTAFTMLESDERSVEFQAPCSEQLEIELAPAVRRHVLLFFKEAVTNVARHAGATTVRVEIEAVKGRFRMSIRDNGRGFDPQHPRAGRGLKSLQYRAGELKGGFQMQSAMGQGTQIELSLLL